MMHGMAQVCPSDRTPPPTRAIRALAFRFGACVGPSYVPAYDSVTMATWSDVRRIVNALPETGEKTTYGEAASWTVHGKLFAWERPLGKSDLEALGQNAPFGAILGIRTVDLEMKAALLAADPAVLFTTPHFDGYCAVLVVLSKVPPAKLRDLLVEAWLARAPKRAAAAFLALNASERRGTGTRRSH